MQTSHPDDPGKKIKTNLNVSSTNLRCLDQRAETRDKPQGKGPGFSYLCHDKFIYDVPKIEASKATCDIIIRHNKKRQTVAVHPSWSGEDVWKYLSSLTCIPLDKLQLIHKGRKLTKDTTQSCLHNKAVFLAIGDRAIPDDDIHEVDIDVLMQQLNIERNDAIRALKKNGDLVDAIIDVGKK